MRVFRRVHVFRRVRAFWRVRVRPTWLAVSYLSNLAIAITTKNIRKRERARKYVRVVTFVVEDKSKALGADFAASVDAPCRQSSCARRQSPSPDNRTSPRWPRQHRSRRENVRHREDLQACAIKVKLTKGIWKHVKDRCITYHDVSTVLSSNSGVRRVNRRGFIWPHALGTMRDESFDRKDMRWRQRKYLFTRVRTVFVFGRSYMKPRLCLQNC